MTQTLWRSGKNEFLRGEDTHNSGKIFQKSEFLYIIYAQKSVNQVYRSFSLADEIIIC